MRQSRAFFFHALARATKTLAEGVLYLWISVVILYGTPFSEVLNIFLGYKGMPLQRSEGVGPLLWWLALAMLLSMLISYALRLARYLPRYVALTMVSAVLFSALYLLDPLLNTMPFYFFVQRDWTLLMWLTFFLAIWVYSTNRRESYLIDFLLFCIGLQALFAIVHHLMGINQFHTPHFGSRTQGTYDNPNIFAPVALIGIGIAIAKSLREQSRSLRLLHALIATLCMVGIWMTYTRASWLALSIMFLAVFLRLKRNISQPVRYGLVALALLFGVGTLFWRTGGRLLGNPDDRSTWGRVAIWKVAWNIYKERPILGHGAMSYRLLQEQSVTPELQAFGPRNSDAKNLLLNLGVEFGIIGVVLFLLFVGAVFYLGGRLASQNARDGDDGFGMGTQLALLNILIAGLFDTLVLESYRVPSTMALMLVAGIVTARTARHYLLDGNALTPATSFETAKRLPLTSRQRPTTRLAFWGALTALLLLGAIPFLSGYLQFRHYQRAIPTFRTQNPARPHFTPLAQIPLAMQHALIASEDGYFLQHHGVDWQA
ncbi:MAG: O-antigen ligase family protein, partial [Armatimonadota bacterium]